MKEITRICAELLLLDSITIEKALSIYTDIINQGILETENGKMQIKTVIASIIPEEDRREFYEDAEMIELLDMVKTDKNSLVELKEKTATELKMMTCDTELQYRKQLQEKDKEIKKLQNEVMTQGFNMTSDILERDEKIEELKQERQAIINLLHSNNNEVISKKAILDILEEEE